MNSTETTASMERRLRILFWGFALVGTLLLTATVASLASATEVNRATTETGKTATPVGEAPATTQPAPTTEATTTTTEPEVDPDLVRGTLDSVIRSQIGDINGVELCDYFDILGDEIGIELGTDALVGGFLANDPDLAEVRALDPTFTLADLEAIFAAALADYANECDWDI